MEHLIGRQPPPRQRAHHCQLFGHPLPTGGVVLGEERLQKCPAMPRATRTRGCLPRSRRRCSTAALEGPVRALHIAVLVSPRGVVLRAPQPVDGRAAHGRRRDPPAPARPELMGGRREMAVRCSSGTALAATTYLAAPPTAPRSSLRCTATPPPSSSR